MHIFVPQTEPNQNNMNNNFMDAINMLSFLIGILNLDLNVTANDIDRQTETILSDLHSYLESAEKHMSIQDKHLNEQDMRLDRLERMMYDRYDVARKESER